MKQTSGRSRGISPATCPPFVEVAWRELPPEAMASPSSVSYCSAATGDTLNRLAVLGIFSTEGRLPFRRAIRGTWAAPADGFSDAPGGILTRFILRGIGASADMRDEAESHGDVVFVRGSAGLKRSSGPLLSLLLWFECAVRAWPGASMIGKGDDDIWVQLPSTAAMLSQSLVTLSTGRQVAHTHANESLPCRPCESLTCAPPPCRQSPPRMLWGYLESYHWDEDARRPTMFGREAYIMGRCKTQLRQRHATLAESMKRVGSINSSGMNAVVSTVGPFGFTKGPMYYLSYSLVKQLVDDTALLAEGQATLRSVNESLPEFESIKPW